MPRPFDYLDVLQQLAQGNQPPPSTPFAPGLGAFRDWAQSEPPAWINDQAGVFTGRTDFREWMYRDLIARNNLLRRRFPGMADQIGLPASPDVEDFAERSRQAAERSAAYPDWLRALIGLR